MPEIFSGFSSLSEPCPPRSKHIIHAARTIASDKKASAADFFVRLPPFRPYFPPRHGIGKFSNLFSPALHPFLIDEVLVPTTIKGRKDLPFRPFASCFRTKADLPLSLAFARCSLRQKPFWSFQSALPAPFCKAALRQNVISSAFAHFSVSFPKKADRPR